MKSCHTSRVNLIKSSVCSLYLFGPFSFSFYHPSPHSSPLHTQPFIFHPLLIPPFSFTLSSLYFTFSTSFTFTHLTIPYLFPSTFLLHFLFLLFIYFPYLSHSFLFYFYFLYSHSFMYTSFSFLYSSSTYPSFYFFTILYFLPYLFFSTYFSFLLAPLPIFLFSPHLSYLFTFPFPLLTPYLFHLISLPNSSCHNLSYFTFTFTLLIFLFLPHLFILSFLLNLLPPFSIPFFFKTYLFLSLDYLSSIYSCYENRSKQPSYISQWSNMNFYTYQSHKAI